MDTVAPSTAAPVESLTTEKKWEQSSAKAGADSNVKVATKILITVFILLLL